MLFDEKKEACDCSPECCKVVDTSYHFHIGNDCFHSYDSKHKISDSDFEEIG